MDDILKVASTLAKNEGLSVLLVEQDITKALAAADRGYVVENGRIVLEGTSAALQADEHVKKAYPVSYTHLDVYKRQGWDGDGGIQPDDRQYQ